MSRGKGEAELSRFEGRTVTVTSHKAGNGVPWPETETPAQGTSGGCVSVGGWGVGVKSSISDMCRHVMPT